MIGGQLRGTVPMQVVSGRLDKPKVYFTAPSRDVLETDLKGFIAWFNTSLTGNLAPLLRAAITHFWFITLHPLEDCNGRITRYLLSLNLVNIHDKLVIKNLT